MLNTRLIAVLTSVAFLTACSSGLFGGDGGSTDQPSAQVGSADSDPAIPLGRLLGMDGGRSSSGAASSSGGGLGLGGLFNFSGGSGQALVVGDEPFAVRAAAQALEVGGSAADAAAAMYFALAVSYPVSAQLGGGGICVVHDSGRNESFDFLARDSSGGGAFAVPGAVRGFALMQQAYGRLPWQRVVSPAEAMAAAGFPVSQALAARLQAAQDVIRLDAGLAAEFLDESGNVKPAGSIVFNRELSHTLSLIRQQGPDGFYTGPVAAKIAAYSAGQGGGLSTAELAAYRPGRVPAQVFNIGSGEVFLPPARLGAGSFQAQLMHDLVDADGHPVANLNSAVAQAVTRALEKFGIASVPQDLGSTGFAVTDGTGQAVACAVTMNGPFGSGHTVEGTGITLARAPNQGQAGLAAAFLSPTIATPPNGSIALAGAGAGGPNGTAALIYAVMRLANGEDVSKPNDMRSTGVAPYDTVNVITCDSGRCAVLPDPGAHGLGAAVEP